MSEKSPTFGLAFDKEFSDIVNSVRGLDKGEEYLELSGIGSRSLDVIEFSNEFFNGNGSNVSDISVDPNSNVAERNVISYMIEAPKGLFRLINYYQLWQLMKAQFGSATAREAVLSDLLGGIYIADFHLFNLPYCYAFSCYDILTNGLTFIKRPKSGPAKHADTFVEHVIQSVVYFSNSVAGAVALPDLFPCLWFLIKKDRESGYLPSDEAEFKKRVEQLFQILTYTFNQPFRSGYQSPFINISVFDKPFLKDLFSTYVYVDGDKVIRFDLEEVDKLQKWYCEWFVRENDIQPFTFPIVTACLSVRGESPNRVIVDQEFKEWAARLNINRGLLNCYAGELGRLSTCCRLRNDFNSKYFNSWGSGGVKIGSHRVVTINLPRIAIESKLVGSPRILETFYTDLESKVRLAHKILKVHRDLLRHEIEKGKLPLYSLGFMDLKTQYSTVGIIGLYEALDILGYDITQPSGLEMAESIIDRINELNSEGSDLYQCPINLEQIPGEAAAVKLAAKDRLMYGQDLKFYSNQFIPLYSTESLATRIKVQGRLDSKMTGGSILHINIADRIQDPKLMSSLIDYAVANGVVYFAVNYNIAKCENSHYEVGLLETCPVCGGSIVENYTRVVGYLTPTSSWNAVRRDEDYKSRSWHSVKVS